MTIKVGDRLPAGTLSEFIEVEGAGCPVGPNNFDVATLTKGRKVVIFGLPGAFTPTCSEQHLPGYVTQAEALKAKGVDEIVCLSVNDAFVMKAWGEDRGTGDKVRLIADGNGDLTKALGLEMDGTGIGFGLRAQRFAMVVDNGTVTNLAVEEPMKFDVSSAESILASL